MPWATNYRNPNDHIPRAANALRFLAPRGRSHDWRRSAALLRPESRHPLPVPETDGRRCPHERARTALKLVSDRSSQTGNRHSGGMAYRIVVAEDARLADEVGMEVGHDQVVSRLRLGHILDSLDRHGAVNAVDFAPRLQASCADPAFSNDPKRMTATGPIRFAVHLNLNQSSSRPQGGFQDRFVGKFARFGMLGQHQVSDGNLLDGGITARGPNDRTGGQAVFLAIVVSAA